MTPEQWSVVNHIFNDAVELPAGERTQFVQHESSGDPTVQAAIAGLVLADESGQDYLELPAAATPEFQHLFSTEESTPLVKAGDVLCERFQIVRQLGEGGMGQVYEAFDLDLQVRIALKTIQPSRGKPNIAVTRGNLMAPNRLRWVAAKTILLCSIAKHTAIEITFRADFCDTHLADIWRNKIRRETYKICDKAVYGGRARTKRPKTPSQIAPGDNVVGSTPTTHISSFPAQSQTASTAMPAPSTTNMTRADK